MSQVTHKVVKGDTLSAIAKRYGVSVDSIVALNNIKNKNRIYVGQVLVIKGKTISSSYSSSGVSGSDTATANGNFVRIDAFGLQANTDDLLFATWTWFGENTAHYEVEWSYYTSNGIWFNGNSSNVTITESTYTPPSNALKVRCRVKPVSNKWKDQKGNEHDFWIGVWCDYKEYTMSDSPPGKPSTPTTSLEQYTLTMRNDNLDINASEIEYEIIQNGQWLYDVGRVSIYTNSSSYSVHLSPGWSYKVRCRGKRGEIYGPWSDYTNDIEMLPNTTSGITNLYAVDRDVVKIEWDAVNAATSYDLQYAEKESYFEGSNGVTTINNIESLSYIVTGLKTGTRYHFRIRATNKVGSSAWSPSKSVVLGEKPEPPSTWSDRTVANIGDKVLLSWMHNTVDGSAQTLSEIEFEVNGSVDTHQIGMDINGKPINTFELPTFMFRDGTKVNWRVRTKGVTEEFSDWSTQRVIVMYAPPTLTLSLISTEGNIVNNITKLPFNIKAVPGSSAQKPIVYSTTIKSKESYTANTPFGKVEVKSGDVVFSDVSTINTNLDIKLHAGNIDLENGIAYEVACTVTMDSGLSAESKKSFRVKWSEVTTVPNAEILVDKERLSVSIRPYTQRAIDAYKVVKLSGSRYIETDEDLPNGFTTAVSVDEAITDTKRQVYQDEQSRLFCIIQNGSLVNVEGSLLSVYRRTYDGKFVLIADNIRGDDNTFVTDPHPSLDYARYRIVAIDESTGGISYSDIMTKMTGGDSIVIQWDESWSNFISEYQAIEDVEYASSSLLKLPYNISISESNSPDVSNVNYIGRQHPVSYYGTSLGVSSTWSTVIDKTDVETLYAIRRLSMYMGDVYVREPSGIGYWATINVSYDKSYDSLIVPISFSITRVEGGI